MIKLYTFPPSTNSRKVRIALLEKGLEFERINVDLSKREQKNPEYLKIHPFGQVPALDDEGFIIYDSTVINEYLEDEYPYPSLMPKDSEGRARARLMEDFRDTHFNVSCVHIMQEMRKPEGERDGQRIDNARARSSKHSTGSRTSSTATNTWRALSASPTSPSWPTSNCWSDLLSRSMPANTAKPPPGSPGSRPGPASPLPRRRSAGCPGV